MACMVNFQLESLDEMLQHLERIGLPLAKEKETSEFGMFAWIEDPDGRRVELWGKIMNGGRRE